MTPAEPPYQRIVRLITDDVRAGRLKPGDSVPGAPQLGVDHGVSKATAQRAINALKAAGILESTIGVGITVTGSLPADEPAGPQAADLARRVDDHEDRIGALEAALLDLYGKTGRPRPTGGAETERKDRRGHGRTDRSPRATGT